MLEELLDEANSVEQQVNSVLVYGQDGSVVEFNFVTPDGEPDYKKANEWYDAFIAYRTPSPEQLAELEAARKVEAEHQDVIASVKVGDTVRYLSNGFGAEQGTPTGTGKVTEVGWFPSMWLPRGEKRWGAITVREGKDYSTSPFLADQWTKAEDGVWEVQLR